jgi:hypothetical protein
MKKRGDSRSKGARESNEISGIVIDEPPPEAPEPETLDDAPPIDQIEPHAKESRAHLFVTREPRREPGDLSLVEPERIQEALETPLAYAAQAMILAEAFRRSTGATRTEAIEYLARLYLGLPDRPFARAAFKEFGPSTGILDIYPLEVAAHLLDHHPGFFTKAGYGRIRSSTETLVADGGSELRFEHAPELKIRGFALVGGGRPGYVFEPAEEAGVYRLLIRSGGRWEILVSAINRAGYTLIERFTVTVRGAAKERARSSRSPYPARKPSKVAAWPMPRLPKQDPSAVLAAPAPDLSVNRMARLRTIEAPIDYHRALHRAQAKTEERAPMVPEPIEAEAVTQPPIELPVTEDLILPPEIATAATDPAMSALDPLETEPPSQEIERPKSPPKKKPSKKRSPIAMAANPSKPSGSLPASRAPVRAASVEPKPKPPDWLPPAGDPLVARPSLGSSAPRSGIDDPTEPIDIEQGEHDP